MPLRSHQEDSTSDTVSAEGLIASILEDGGLSNLKVVIARNEKYGTPHIEEVISPPCYLGTSSFGTNNGSFFRGRIQQRRSHLRPSPDAVRIRQCRVRPFAVSPVASA